MGCYKEEAFDIVLKDPEPYAAKPYRMSASDERFAEQEVQGLIDCGVV